MKKLSVLILTLLLAASLVGCAGDPIEVTVLPGPTETVTIPLTPPEAPSYTPEPDVPIETPVPENWEEPEDLQESAGTRYILNTNSKKFHDPDCSSVKQMSEKNKQEVVCTREDLIDEGYEPCKRCKP